MQAAVLCQFLHPFDSTTAFKGIYPLCYKPRTNCLFFGKRFSDTTQSFRLAWFVFRICVGDAFIWDPCLYPSSRSPLSLPPSPILCCFSVYLNPNTVVHNKMKQEKKVARLIDLIGRPELNQYNRKPLRRPFIQHLKHNFLKTLCREFGSN